MNAILTVERAHADGTTSSYALTPTTDGYVAAGVHRGRTAPDEHLAAATAVEAIAACAALNEIDEHDVVTLTRHDASLLDRDDLLDALRVLPRSGADEVETDTHATFDAKWWPETSADKWSTWHRVTLDGERVFGLRLLDGRVVLVHAEPEQPHYAWKELLAFHWDSSSWSAVGMSGSGTDGVYLVRPGLVAVVNQQDNEVEVRAEQVDRDARPADLVAPHLDEIVAGDGSWAQIALAAHGFTTDDIREDDYLGTSLDRDELHRFLRR